MIPSSDSIVIGDALTRFAKNHPERVRIRYSNGGDDHPFTANDAELGASGIQCLEQVNKTKNCGSCGLLCALTPRNITFIGHAKKLPDTHPAIVNGTSRYQGKLTHLNPLEAKTVLKFSTNDKLGKKVEKGQWKGHKFLTLTLVERETCPITCIHWNDCYGNNMHAAHRFSTDGLMDAIERDLNNLPKNEMFVVRLHVLGDFYSVEYVEFWDRMMSKFDNIKIYGYTAHPIDNSHLFNFSEKFEIMEVA